MTSRRPLSKHNAENQAKLRERKMNQPQVEPPNVDLPRGERPKCYYVPRRFNLRAMMVLTTVIAAVCAVLQRFTTHPAPYIAIAVMSGVAAGAQVLFPKCPRFASMLAGGIVHALLAACFISPAIFESYEPLVFFIVLFSGISFVLVGFAHGYVFGLFTAGVFMISDWLSPTSMFNHDQNPQPPEKQPR